jgi:hypothetical protein
MPQCSLVLNQENGLANIEGVSGAGPIGFSLAHEHYAHQVCLGPRPGA